MTDRSEGQLINKTIENIRTEYLKNELPWYLGFSGGKDSSALLILVSAALVGLKKKNKPINILYCSTGVEIPIVEEFVRDTFKQIRNEPIFKDLLLITQIVYPEVKNRYFSKVIGRGYPPPTNKFRWCTDVLRIRPFNKYIQPSNGNSVVLLGIRNGESKERDKILAKYSTINHYYYKQYSNKNIINYSPIIDYKTLDIWSVINNKNLPDIINRETLSRLYSLGDLDNDIYKEANLFPFKARLGCWTCTVIRKDKAIKSLIESGYKSLIPLYEFRNWLISIRDEPKRRCNKRRNGQLGLGPFTIDTRREIFERLQTVQRNVEWQLISVQEIEYIKEQWILDSDQVSKFY